jgi:DNA processing protein
VGVVSVATLPDAAYAAALATSGIGPVKLAALLAEHGPRRAWARAGAALDVEAVWSAHCRAGVAVHVLGDAGYPELLAPDTEAPAVLFSKGSLASLTGPRVAIVGTRRCTQAGREIARQFGRELAEAGVTVVSGLALGIDGAAHEGVLMVDHAAPVAVVGSGLDVVYPRRHERLWSEVGQRGALLSEAALGTRPEAWRFPARNRILAALAQVVVVVESHAAGGSLHTVRSALDRGITVMAVPGSIRNPAAAGTNQLLAEGMPPVRDVEDILVALDLCTGGTAVRPARTRDRRPAASGDDAAVLDAIGWEAASTEMLLVRTDLPPGRLAVALSRLEEAGWISRTAGWFERVGP